MLPTILRRFWSALLRRLMRLGSLLHIHGVKRLLSLLLGAVSRRVAPHGHKPKPSSTVDLSPKSPAQHPPFYHEEKPSGSPINVHAAIPSTDSKATQSQVSLNRLEEGLSENPGSPQLEVGPDEKSPSKEHLNGLPDQPTTQPIDASPQSEDQAPKYESDDTQAGELESTPSLRLIPVRPYDRIRWIENHNRLYRKSHIQSSIYPLVEIVPENWKLHVHPRGYPYYETWRGERLYFTNANVTHVATLVAVHKGIDTMERIIMGRDDFPAQGIQIYIEPWYREGIWECKYWMANTAPGCRWLFWLEPYDITGLPWPPICNATDTNNFVTTEYWRHVNLYPHCVVIDKEFLDEANGMLIHLLMECIIIPTHTLVPFLRADIVEMQGALEQMKGLVNCVEARPYVARAVGLLMVRIVDTQCTYFYGQHAAIEEQETSGVPDRTLLIRFLSPILFSAPDRYLRQLWLVDPDEFWRKNNWRQFVAALEKPWSDFILYATVLLAVNVSYLAVPGIVLAGQIASLCSTVLSIGCTVVGLLLVSEDHTDPKANGEVSRVYFRSLKSDKFGYEPVAILYSLPFALLMWSMVTFVLAIGFLCFETDDVERGIIALPAAIVLFLVAYDINIHWKSSTGEEGTLYQRTAMRVHSLVHESLPSLWAKTAGKLPCFHSSVS